VSDVPDSFLEWWNTADLRSQRQRKTTAHAAWNAGRAAERASLPEGAHGCEPGSLEDTIRFHPQGHIETHLLELLDAARAQVAALRQRLAEVTGDKLRSAELALDEYLTGFPGDDRGTVLTRVWRLGDEWGKARAEVERLSTDLAEVETALSEAYGPTQDLPQTSPADRVRVALENRNADLMTAEERLEMETEILGAEVMRLRAEVRTQHKSGCCRTRWGNDPCAFCENATNVCACQDCITPPVGEDTP